MNTNNKPKIQAAGILLLLCGILFSPTAYNSIITNGSVNQIVTNLVITLFFLGFGMGCIFKPDCFGPIASALAEIGKNMSSSGEHNVDQRQDSPSHSPQVNAGRDVSITYTNQDSTSKINNLEKLQKEMDSLISPLYAKSHGTVKKIYFMKGSPGYIDSTRRRDKDYFDFWENVSQNIYLAPDPLRNAYKEYVNQKSNTVGDTSRGVTYENAEMKFINEIEIRYEELRDQLKN
jgi:hypothetical protein